MDFSPICALLLVAFVVLKLVGFITWSWLWVLSPIWIPVLIVFVCYVFILGMVAFKHLYK